MIELKGGEVNQTGDFENYDLSPEEKENDTLEVSFEDLEVNYEIPPDYNRDSIGVKVISNSAFDFSDYKSSRKRGRGFKNQDGELRKGNDKADLEVFPNPVTGNNSYLVYDITNIEHSTKDNSLHIVDLQGRTIKKLNIQNKQENTVPLDMNKFQDGTYFAIISSGDKVIKTRKFVVQ